MKASQWYDILQKIWQKARFALIGLGVLAICLIFFKLGQIPSSRLVRSLLPNPVGSHHDTVKLSFVVPNDEAPQWQSLIDEFKISHSNIDIDLVNLRDHNAIKPQDPRAVKKQYTDWFKSKENSNQYDLVFMDIIWVPEFAEQQWIQELPPQSTNSEKEKLTKELEQFLRDDVEGGLYQNKRYRLPVRSDVGWLYYRKDLLKETGKEPPDTFQELLKIAQDLKAQGKVRWGYLWQGRQSEALSAMFVEVLRGHGGFWIDEKREVGLDRPEAIAAVQFLHDTMFKANPISPPTLTTFREDETLKAFLDGDAAFLRNWSYVLPRANLTSSDIRSKIGVKPMVHAAGYTSGGCQGGWGLGISKKTQHPKEAWEAVQFFSSVSAQRKLFLMASDGLPTRRELFKDPQLVKRYSHYPAILNFFENQKPHRVVLRPAIPEYAQATCILQKSLHTALTQKNVNIKEHMEAAAEDTRILLNPKKGTLKERDCVFSGD
jgi:multiple sugar transport system substrate-binding protein